jgi:hypothetical protein
MKAWNPSPKVAAARDFGRKHRCDRVVILFTTRDGQVGYASWGHNQIVCAETKELADKAYDAFCDAIGAEED